ncbi:MULTISPECIES: tetratricopeptide repeat protein [Butyricimonas]|uniref:tetratricopeptide repeat protein n=1 Tax=Butyricimonas TaxID=574697 RepID=UPI00258EFF91|nr:MULTISPECIES: SEL1-like repeat protein [Butyricimonas]
MKSLFGMVYFQKFLNVVLLSRITPVAPKGMVAAFSTYSGNVLRDNEEGNLRVKLIHDKNINRKRILRTIVCILLCLLGISRVSIAQQEDNLLRREYQMAMEEHMKNMIAALSMYSSDIYYEKENVLRTRRVKLIRLFFRSEQAKMYDFLKIGVETQDNYLDVMEFLRTIPVVLPRVTFNMSVEEISPYVRLASGEFKLPVKVAITFVDLNTDQEKTMPSRMYNVYYWQAEDGDFAVSSMDLLREEQQTLSGITTGFISGKTYKEYEKMANEFYDKKNYTEALKYYKLSALGNDGNILNQLGYMYLTGEGVEADDSEAAKWFRKAAEAGNVTGQYNLGWMYETGRGVTKNIILAKRWYEKAAAQNDGDAQSRLGDIYYNGDGITKDYAKAREWYLKAAGQGNMYGEFGIGLLYEFGCGLTKNMDKAAEWYLKAANRGYDRAIEKLKVLSGITTGFTSGKTYKEYEKMADEFYDKRNYTEALKYYKLSALGNDGNILNQLGYMYLTGEGVEADDSEAAKWFRKAAEAGNVTGQYNLGWMYETGRGVTKNIILAKRWYEKAAAQNDGDAQSRLGDIYYNGDGITKDYAKAREWYLKAAGQGNMYGEFGIGLLYEFGCGLTKNIDKAAEWYRRAANRGMERAKTKLKELGR